MRKPLILGNWKMYGSQSRAAELAGAIAVRAAQFPRADIGVCPPFVLIPTVRAALQNSGVAWGAQDASAHEEGAFTGEVSAAMLKDLGCTYVLLGHSERRQYHAESSALVAAKTARAYAQGLRPVVCVGETLSERQAGTTSAVIAAQLAPVCGLDDAAAVLRNAVIAYEPVWAIGTGETASPAQAQAVHADIRALVSNLDPDLGARMRILYGGSVKPANAHELFAMPDIDGGLIGGASLKADDFCAIIAAV